jgi:acyl dehydratase
MEMKPGASATVLRTFSQRDFDRFAVLSGDDNPIHVDPAFAARTRFGRTVAHGMLLYSAISAALAYAHEKPDRSSPSTELRRPVRFGAGDDQLEQELMFLTPTYVGEEVAICLEVTAVDEARGTAELVTNVVRPGGEFACQGRAVVAVGSPKPDRSSRPVRFDSIEFASEHKGLRVGQTAQTVRTFTTEDLREYRELSGDPHPTERVPGGLLGGLFSYLLGTKLPGRGTNWLKQRLEYPAPCFAGEEITATVEITRLRPEKDLVNLRGECVAGGRVVCAGESLVLVKDLEE